jgi:hypothetical protein
MIAEYSHAERILTDGQPHIPPSAIFGAEPAHDWCYYYQKASLARQQGNWDEVVSLYGEAVSLNLEPNDKSEIVPFIEGFVNAGRSEEALELYNDELKGFIKIRLPLCNALEKNPSYNPAPGYDYENVYKVLCNS